VQKYLFSSTDLSQFVLLEFHYEIKLFGGNISK